MINEIEVEGKKYSVHVVKESMTNLSVQLACDGDRRTKLIGKYPYYWQRHRDWTIQDMLDAKDHECEQLEFEEIPN